MLKLLEVYGLRGFAEKQTLRFSVPNGERGSGLTILVGANNAGKSTAIEALRAIALWNGQNPSFSVGKRNHDAGDQIFIRIVGDDNRETTIKSIRSGSSETEISKTNKEIESGALLVLPSRRVFNPYFSRAPTSRSHYMAQMQSQPIRSSSLDPFTSRLFEIEKNRDSFDDELRKVIDPVPNWSIDQMDTGQHFLKIRKGNTTHSSEGLGEGLVSLLYIIDALYDAKDGHTIAIDEPELSLHPALQRKLAALFMEHSRTRQIILSTHSPYFACLEALANGGTIARVHVVNETSKISQLTTSTAQAILGLMKNQNNPHILGLNAQEVFFIEDQVILVEGQEDVIFFQRVQEEIKIPLAGTFFGWGVGGAENMEKIAAVLNDLGYSKVVGILDANRANLVAELTTKFPTYHFFAIPTNDVRTKKAVQCKAAIVGLLNDDNTSIRPEYVAQTHNLFVKANQYLSS
ncbi:MAG: ATP-binding protein [Burkholderiaceae bacterium]|jgi:predicted ATPase|nr:ATP-binding protein [Burkholderiaceae bacterium]